MNAIVQERKLSFTSEYDISVGSSNYRAQRAMFSFRRLQIQTTDGQVVARIRGHVSLFRSKYDFTLTDGRSYRFCCAKVWKRVFTCEGNGEHFRLFEHKGLRWSIFSDDKQVAAVTKNRLVFGNGNRFDVQMNAVANLLVILCMVLSLNTSENDDHNATVTIDIGNIGPEERPFDENWRPS